MTQLIKDLWTGERPLRHVFWHYAVGYGLLVNLVTQLALLAVLLNDASLVLAVLAFALPIPYNVFSGRGCVAQRGSLPRFEVMGGLGTHGNRDLDGGFDGHMKRIIRRARYVPVAVLCLLATPARPGTAAGPPPSFCAS